ncbi:Alpha galactosidase A [Tessaracoccus bendigoensis DSM 12906]|uniref:Alpha-galactosidase n=1 Tax=Tessaracoccus bendigoensis DSM 12906 TaxID=1123357 RepID=A0A1M6CZC4_9ACTN|nr:glycoside hydrolase family 27 protein [Tessaracoccus bendigoensis]SHI66372.1 Alpha galactosidase A [Tessaracoccus bendigoensis DSM 12906]
MTRPPLGWNSWDCFGGSVTEAEVLSNAEFMAAHLLPHGWDHVVVDIQWYEPDPGFNDYRVRSSAMLDANGRPQPAINRFPSATDGRGFTSLANRIHSLGLKFGVHLMRGIPRRAVAADLPIAGAPYTAREIADQENRCPWNPDNDGVDASHPGAAQWYDSLIAMLADWGVDFIKLDDVLYPPVQRAEIKLISEAIGRTGRDISLSLSPGRELSLEQLDFLRTHSAMWRVSDDLWDDWSAVLEQFQRAARWAPFQGDAGFADLDMLPLGRIGLRAHVGTERDSNLTPAEQRTMVTLWSIARSPMMFGGHPPYSAQETVDLLTNDAVLAVNQRSDHNREIIRDGDLIIWAATLDGDQVRAVFWLGDEPTTRSMHRFDLGVADTDHAIDLWSGARIPVRSGWLSVDLEPHDAVLLRLS